MQLSFTRLSSKIIFITVLGVLLVMVITAIVVVNMEREALFRQSRLTQEILENERKEKEAELSRQLLTEGELVATLLAQVVPQAILNYDFQALQTYVDGLVQNKQIVFAGVYDVNAQPLTAMAAVDENDSDLVILQKDCFDAQGEKRGAVKVILTQQLLKKRLLETDQQIDGLLKRLDQSTKDSLANSASTSVFSLSRNSRTTSIDLPF